MTKRLNIQPEYLLMLAPAAFAISLMTALFLNTGMQADAKEEAGANKRIPCEEQAWPRISAECLDLGETNVRMIERVYVRGS